MVFLFSIPLSPQLSKNNRNTIARTRFGKRITKSNSYRKAYQDFFIHLSNRLKKVNFKEYDSIEIDGLLLTEVMNLDAHNFIDAIMDILQKVTGINDRKFKIGSWECARLKTSLNPQKCYMILGVAFQKNQTGKLKKKSKESSLSQEEGIKKVRLTIEERKNAGSIIQEKPAML